jgi:2-oxoacid:acceptor oxidoreductase delta subunit (pyruvate/2-ketoisovalerate family)
VGLIFLTVRNIMAKECKKEVVLRQKRKGRSLRKQKKGTMTVEPGLAKGEALKEARRCLSLRECESCEVCELLCPDLCITRDEKTGEVLIDVDYCKGCGICASVCPRKAIQMVLEE